jgi:hypothetical protein
MMLFYWEALASGQERPAIAKTRTNPSGWGYDGNFRTASEWGKFIFDTIDPTTDEWRPHRPQWE